MNSISKKSVKNFFLKKRSKEFSKMLESPEIFSIRWRKKKIFYWQDCLREAFKVPNEENIFGWRYFEEKEGEK